MVLARQQLFTENTVTAILPLLDDPNRGRHLVARAAHVVRRVDLDLVGAAIFAAVIAHTGIFDPSLKASFLALGEKMLGIPFWVALLRGVFAGWLIALMVWLLPSADAQKAFVVIAVTYVVGALGLTHIIAGSIDTMYVVAAGHASPAAYIVQFFLPVLAGNTIGGVLLVSLLNYGEIAMEEA